MAGAQRLRELPADGVRFGSDFLNRLQKLSARLSALRTAREGAGLSRLGGGGEELVGYMPYRPGQDLRRLDWNLFARLDRPYVRVMRREAAERWALLVDTSASMGVGPPGKLQRAAEVVCGLASLALGRGAEVAVSLSPGEGDVPRELRVRRRAEVPNLMAFFEAARARGTGGLGRLLERPSVAADCGRVFAVGDWLDERPEQIASLQRRGRELAVVQVLAPLELSPGLAGTLEWTDPEGPDRARVRLDARTCAAYEEELERRLEALHAFCKAHGIGHTLGNSASPFEDLVRAALEP